MAYTLALSGTRTVAGFVVDGTAGGGVPSCTPRGELARMPTQFGHCPQAVPRFALTCVPLFLKSAPEVISSV